MPSQSDGTCMFVQYLVFMHAYCIHDDAAAARGSTILVFSCSLIQGLIFSSLEFGRLALTAKRF